MRGRTENGLTIPGGNVSCLMWISLIDKAAEPQRRTQSHRRRPIANEMGFERHLLTGHKYPYGSLLGQSTLLIRLANLPVAASDRSVADFVVPVTGLEPVTP